MSIVQKLFFFFFTCISLIICVYADKNFCRIIIPFLILLFIFSLELILFFSSGKKYSIRKYSGIFCVLLIFLASQIEHGVIKNIVFGIIYIYLIGHVIIHIKHLKNPS
jgi:hypothetical protein